MAPLIFLCSFISFNKIFTFISRMLEFKKQPPEVFCKKRCSHRFCKIHRKTPLAQVFSYEFCEISKNTFFIEHFWATASGVYNISSVFSKFLCHVYDYFYDSFYMPDPYPLKQGAWHLHYKFRKKEGTVFCLFNNRFKTNWRSLKFLLPFYSAVNTNKHHLSKNFNKVAMKNSCLNCRLKNNRQNVRKIPRK